MIRSIRDWKLHLNLNDDCVDIDNDDGYVDDYNESGWSEDNLEEGNELHVPPDVRLIAEGMFQSWEGVKKHASQALSELRDMKTTCDRFLESAADLEILPRADIEWGGYQDLPLRELEEILETTAGGGE